MRSFVLALLIFFAIGSTAQALPKGFKPFTDEAFESALATGEPVVVQMHSEWCHACKVMEKHIASLINGSYAGQATVFQLEWDRRDEFAFKRDYKIWSLSSVVVFRNGEETGRMNRSGPRSEVAALFSTAM